MAASWSATSSPEVAVTSDDRRKQFDVSDIPAMSAEYVRLLGLGDTRDRVLMRWTRWVGATYLIDEKVFDALADLMTLGEPAGTRIEQFHTWVSIMAEKINVGEKVTDNSLSNEGTMGVGVAGSATKPVIQGDVNVGIGDAGLKAALDAAKAGAAELELSEDLKKAILSQIELLVEKKSDKGVLSGLWLGVTKLIDLAPNAATLGAACAALKAALRL